jgi:D-beta-D-heptose 7-phosphate kinase/D-beta-D-heptose 1-phosphate adenosyltransferase
MSFSRTAKIYKDPLDLKNYLDITDNSLLRERKLITVSGGFDPLHKGHLRYIKEASLLGTLVVIVNGDDFLTWKKGKPFMGLEERMEIISGISGVDFVTSWDDDSRTVSGCLEILRPDVFAKGGDRSDTKDIPELKVCNEIGCKIIVGVGGVEKVQSSSDLLKVEKINDVGYQEDKEIKIDPFDIPSETLDGIIDGFKKAHLDLQNPKKFIPSTSKKPRIVSKPWGQEIIWAETDRYAGKILNINAFQKLSIQYHEKKEETVYPLYGRVRVQTFLMKDDESLVPDQDVTLLPGNSFHISPGTIHRFSSYSENSSLLEVSTSELDDVIRIQDDYDRLD